MADERIQGLSMDELEREAAKSANMKALLGGQVLAIAAIFNPAAVGTVALQFAGLRLVPGGVRPTPTALLYALPQPIGIVPPKQYGLPPTLFSVEGAIDASSPAGRELLHRKLGAEDVQEQRKRLTALQVSIRDASFTLLGIHAEIVNQRANDFNSEQIAERRIIGIEQARRGLAVTVGIVPTTAELDSARDNRRLGFLPVFDLPTTGPTQPEVRTRTPPDPFAQPPEGPPSQRGSPTDALAAGLRAGISGVVAAARLSTDP
jgi:hypothetical protein